ncbi:MAG: hypothetical protein RRA94_00255, partial [Bacteroidota bacterium]|nr:hypothetical protein [Bacteroidota bacterium]
QSCDQDAILFTGGDNDTFPVWYLQYAAGIRRDVRVVNLSLLNTEWYSKQLKNERPYGAKVVAMSYTDTELAALRPVQWDARRISVPLDPEKIAQSTLVDVPQVQRALEAQMPQALEISVPATYTDPAGTKGIRIQDILIIDILNNNFNDRPIHFALSTSPNDRVGLENHLFVEGLTYRVSPVSFGNRGGRYYQAMNIEETRRHLTELRQEPDSNRAYGFMFRELDNPKVNLDEASTKMIFSFRALYMGLAQIMAQENGNIDGAKAVLDTMEDVMPSAYHRFDESLRTDLANFYIMVGDTAEYLKIGEEMEEYFISQLDTDDPGNNPTGRNAYIFLLNYYDASGRYEDGINLLRRLQGMYPQDQGIQEQINALQRKMQGPPAAPAVTDTATM